MELFIVIVIIGLAAVYIIKIFYNKYKTGKAGDSNCSCASCDSNDLACSRSHNKLPIDYIS
ncbi:MAG: hypothetical protein BBJ57_09260 [Desulfobacterales bacterium PC51MH44]|nr:MAG: hypothetical protein BBJ57_09260 [Desulfobacterales bacterium PC51MH44]